MMPGDLWGLIVALAEIFRREMGELSGLVALAQYCYGTQVVVTRGSSEGCPLSRVNYICRLASISFAGSPPWPGPVAGRRWCGSWGRQTPG